MKRILIVGNRSYIGQSFIKYIRDYEKVYQLVKRQGVDHNETNYETLDIDAVSGSTGEWKQTDFSKYDSVLLLSGIVHRKETKENKKLYMEVNYHMAVEIARKAKESGVTQFIFMSTIAVYGDQVSHINETTQPNPITEYARTKRLAEQEISKLVSNSFKVAIVRPPMVYGKNCPGNFTKLVCLIKKVKFFPSIQNQRSVIYIDNLSEFLRLIICKNMKGYFHPQDERYLCTSMVAEAIEHMTESKIRRLYGLSKPVSFVGRYNVKFKKIFGNLYCDMKLSQYNDIDYCVVNQVDAIRRSI